MWVRTNGLDLYPNLYTILVGPPGIGKGVAMNPADSILRKIPDIHVGPSDMTSASLIDALNESVRRIILMGDPPYVEFNSLIVLSRELSVLMPAWDAAMLGNLTDIYDGFVVNQKRRGRDLNIKITHPQINLLSATTPSYLNEFMPSGAWDQGFTSRTLFIYSGDRVAKDPFDEDTHGSYVAGLYDDLLSDLKTVATEYGRIGFAVESVEAIRAWVKAGCPPEPEHARLQYYNSRRFAHLMKLCMVSSISRSSDHVIKLENYTEALDWLVEAETAMGDIFKSMTSGGDSTAMEDTWQFVWTLYAKERKPIAEHRIVHFLREKVPAHAVMGVLNIMVKSKMFEVEFMGSFNGYKPASKASRMEGR